MLRDCERKRDNERVARPNDCFDMLRLRCFSQWRGVGGRGYGGSGSN